ncbi:MAG: LCI fold-containing protein [Faecalibacillus sp.]
MKSNNLSHLNTISNSFMTRDTKWYFKSL